MLPALDVLGLGHLYFSFQSILSFIAANNLLILLFI